MATSILLDKKVMELGFDDLYESHVFVEYQSTSDIVTVKAGGQSIHLGVTEAGEIALALAEYVKYFGSIEKTEEIKTLFKE